MASNADADVVILGAGCAGLSLASELAIRSPTTRVIALEARPEYADDRSWCFWRPVEHDLSHLVSHSWNAWRFGTSAGRTETHSVPGVAYHYLRGIDFYAQAIERIDNAPHTELRTGVTTGQLRPVSGGVQIDTDAGQLVARHVIDTRPRRLPARLYQCFAGVEIDCDAPHGLDPAVADLMTQMTSDADGLGFVYALPLDAHRALIEWTRFSEHPLPHDEIAAGLAGALQRMGLSGARVVRSERGVLGMGSAASPEPPMAGVVVAGNAGGAVRAASGYAFLRIQRWAALCAAAVARSGTPVGHPAEPSVRGQMDRIFLQALRAHPERTAEYFMALASGCPPRRLVRFLSDRANLADYAGLIASLPLRPFLAQLLPIDAPRFEAVAALR